jgi:hypothetical protein
MWVIEPLRPERSYEGADAPLIPGAQHRLRHVNQLPRLRHRQVLAEPRSAGIGPALTRKFGCDRCCLATVRLGLVNPMAAFRDKGDDSFIHQNAAVATTYTV